MDPNQRQEQPPEAKKLPIRRTETSLIKDEFDSLRARFDAEMRQMEEDMARFRSQMQSSFSSRKQFSSSKTSTTTTTSQSTARRNPIEPGAEQQQFGALQEASAAASSWGPDGDWLEGFANSPMVVSSPESREKLLKLRFDVSAYEPDKIVVTTFDDRLKVGARREETTDHKSVVSEYNREFLLPAGVDHDLIKSSLSADGILTVEVPLTPRASS